jgi:hypothetical protein
MLGACNKYNNNNNNNNLARQPQVGQGLLIYEVF